LAQARAAFDRYRTTSPLTVCSRAAVLIPDYRDLDKRWADLGYTTCIAVPSKHLELINALMAPSAEQIAALCAAYEQARQNGEPAAVSATR